ncbi:MAG: DUF1846 domain-containing protein [Oscillospiraceae bacterium]|nr:DUF1846 domain-containing protein [Oscillospiraceae bacterium]
MTRIGFDNDKYIKEQSEQIRKRISKFGGKLYLEFGGKLFDDYHASRVLPGFKPDSKMKMLVKLKDQIEIVIAINSADIEKNKVRGDLGITYDLDTLRLIDAFRDFGFMVGSVVLTRFASQPAAEAFQNRLEALGLKVYRHYPISGYPTDISTIVSSEGYGKNDYIETSRSLVVVTAPGPGSGKMATCLSQLYHDNLRGIKAGYAKFETFPVWNLPLRHPVNLAYEAATADLKDVNVLDSYHIDAYGELAVNYNRDMDVFPVLYSIFERIYGESPYKSPTDMGVNMAGHCIIDDEAVRAASKDEIVRRYFIAKCNEKKGLSDGTEAMKIELLMKAAGVDVNSRPARAEALEREDVTGEPAAAIQLNDGRIISGKTSHLLGAISATLINALKVLGNIEEDIHLISPTIIEPVQDLKVNHLSSQNPRLHTDEVLVALSICAATDPKAEKAIHQLSKLKGCEAHSTVILSQVDETIMKKLGINITCEPKYQSEKLFHK